MTSEFTIRPATRGDVPEILRLIGELAEYEKLSDMLVGTEAMLAEQLFGARRAAECLIAERGARAVGFALFFTTFSTFLCKPGLYLEDLFVEPGQRGHGIGKELLKRLAALAVKRDSGRFEWRGLDWNMPSIKFYASLGANRRPEWTVGGMTSPEFAAPGKRSIE